ncbi:GNAT family N-acetyltransferase [Paenibacillus tengchongensis]|uniref:GNAT family N-acetyltransferase n=1 Tax=Paenibacillus tengchongensis TaxID=2608684 RepID=UPI001FE2DA05|nr:GNAT family N-acetyltransferase [Paenibacillus tengchongensis]
MRLVDVTKENWLSVILLTTNMDNQHTLGEEFVASNAYSIIESFYEGNWTIKAIEHGSDLIGFAMYGIPEGSASYELCRFMIDRKFQGRGYGKQALALIIDEMVKHFGCKEICLSTDPANAKGKHIYESLGFTSTGQLQDDEEVYILKIQ